MKEETKRKTDAWLYQYLKRGEGGIHTASDLVSGKNGMVIVQPVLNSKEHRSRESLMHCGRSSMYYYYYFIIITEWHDGGTPQHAHGD